MSVTPKGNDVFERFTDQARQTVRNAAGAAQRLNDDRVGDEHILLALAAPNCGVARAVLSRSGSARKRPNSPSRPSGGGAGREGRPGRSRGRTATRTWPPVNTGPVP